MFEDCAEFVVPESTVSVRSEIIWFSMPSSRREVASDSGSSGQGCKMLVPEKKDWQSSTSVWQKRKLVIGNPFEISPIKYAIQIR
jgi:hypothetical protein